MSDAIPDMYAGLDQMIARSTGETRKNAAKAAKSQSTNSQETRQQASTTPLKPDELKPLRLYRKQTFYLGEAELSFLDRAQEAMKRQHKQDVYRNDLIRCALELLAKDYEINKDKSFLVRKFVRR